MKTYKLKIVDPLDDPIYRYRKTGCNEWDEYYDAVGNIRVQVGGYNYTGQNINLVFPAPLCMHENPPLA